MTIEAKELRIGNYVWMCIPRLNDKMIIRDHRVHSTDIVHQENGSTLLEPIPLTEEWLVRFGFVKSRGTIYLYEYYTFDIEDGVMYYGGSINSYNIKYVHQLQNLYFALTREELTLSGK